MRQFTGFFQKIKSNLLLNSISYFECSFYNDNTTFNVPCIASFIW